MEFTMNIPLFHVSPEKYCIGAIFKPKLHANSYRFEIDHEFDKRKPDDVPTRSDAVFAFDSIIKCKFFWDAQRNHSINK